MIFAGTMTSASYDKRDFMNYAKLGLFSILIMASGGGCVGNRIATEAQNNPVLLQYVQATKVFEALIREGGVPDFRTNDQGRVMSPRIGLYNETRIQYPYHVYLQVERGEESNAIYWITMKKIEVNSGWELVEVWKTDTRAQNGHYMLQNAALKLKGEQTPTRESLR